MNSKQKRDLDHRLAKGAYLSVKATTESRLDSEKDLLTALQRAGRNPSRKCIDKYWTKTTKSLTFHDFAHILNTEPETEEKDLQKAFNKIDVNRDNKISFVELRSVLIQKGEGLSEAEIEEIFEDADLNKDGVIDYQEFVRMVHRTTEETKAACVRRAEKTTTSPAAVVKKRSRSLRDSRSSLSSEHATANGHGDRYSSESSSSPKKLSTVPGRRKSASTCLEMSPPNGAYKSGPNAKSLTNWCQISRKGFFLYDGYAESVCSSGHRYRLSLQRADTVWFSVETVDSPDVPSTSQRRSLDILLVILQDGATPTVISLTDSKDDQGRFHTKCNLKAGEYLIFPYTSGNCFKPRPVHAKQKPKAQLLESGEQIRLTKQYRVSLMNIFDMFDLDDDGRLDREEFNVYNVITGDDSVTDQEWSVVQQNFDTKDGALTIKGFIQLHQMEAEDGEGDTEDMWVSLHACGYNDSLIMDQAFPFLVNVYAEDTQPKLKIEGVFDLRHGKEWTAFMQYSFRKSHIVQNMQNVQIRQLSSPFWVMLLIHKQKPNVKLSECQIHTAVNCIFDKEKLTAIADATEQNGARFKPLFWLTAREIKEAFFIHMAGDNGIPDENIGFRSAVYRSRGLNLDPFWSILFDRFPALP